MGLPENSGLELYSMHPHGGRNLITDVPGVLVGHKTVTDGKDIHTGVTAILPQSGDIFHEKLTAGVTVINGFGKSTGLIQIKELGTLETPILMTNTLSVGTCLTALVRYMLERNEDIGVETGTVNCVVTECNDGLLNDIRGLHVTEQDARDALEGASEEFAEGAVGAGKGMCCLGLKGGIGSASRLLEADGQPYTVGALVLANFGNSGYLTVGGDHIGRRIAKLQQEAERGSIIIVIATDAPLNERQLERVAERSMVALGRTGSCCGNGSGDIALAFSTGNRYPHYSEQKILPSRYFHDAEIDDVFECAIEATEEAIISALYHAETTRGIRGNIVRGLRDYL